MIGYIRGKIAGVFEDFCFIEAGGIGYRVYISDRDRQELHMGEEAKLLTHLAVREDAFTLYGFLSQEAYELFLLLISVSKIGPKVAMGILSSARPEQFSMAVRNKDIAALTKLPGIGKKTAERLVLELKDKVGAFGGEEMSGTGTVSLGDEEGIAAEAIAALHSLGYEPEEVRGVVLRLAETARTPQALIGAALRELGKQRA